MLRYCSVLIFVVAVSISGWTQQGTLSSLYFTNPYSFNSAFGGLEGSLFAALSYRDQWQSLEGSPLTQSVEIHAPVYYIRGGVGIGFQSDQVGLIRSHRFSLSYNYVAQTNAFLWSAGLRLHWLQYGLDESKLRTPEGNYIDGSIEHEDPILGTERLRAGALQPELSIFVSGINWDAGLSFKQFPSGEVRLNGETLRITTLPQITIFSEYNYELSNRWEILPSLLWISDFKKWQADLGFRALYNGNIFGGIAIRGYNRQTLDALVCMAGVRLNKQWKLGYAYDLTLSDLADVNTGTHELSLTYNLGKKLGGAILPPIRYSPRHL